jgi:glycerophosphoryl diester phosphodiesterase
MKIRKQPETNLRWILLLFAGWLAAGGHAWAQGFGTGGFGTTSGRRSTSTNTRGTPRWRTDLYANSGTLMTHDESIALIKSLGAKFTPELKAPEVPMPFDGDYTQEKYASQMLDAYKRAGLPGDVFAQSFNLADIPLVKTDRLRRAGGLSRGPLREEGLIRKAETWKPR